MTDLAERKCEPCREGTPPLGSEEADELLRRLDGWKIDGDGKRLAREFRFEDYHRTMAFVNAVAWIAHREDHHPDLEVGYNRCVVRYSTHSIGGLSPNDFICAAKVDRLLQGQPTPWSWPDDLDAVVAAPGHHRILLENDSVRVLDTRIEPGETVPLHTHRWPAVYHILSWSDFVRRDADGRVLVDSRESPAAPPPAASWSPPLPPHTLENVGSAAIHLVSVEVKTVEPTSLA